MEDQKYTPEYLEKFIRESLKEKRKDIKENESELIVKTLLRMKSLKNPESIKAFIEAY